RDSVGTPASATTIVLRREIAALREERPRAFALFDAASRGMADVIHYTLLCPSQRQGLGRILQVPLPFQVVARTSLTNSRRRRSRIGGDIGRFVEQNPVAGHGAYIYGG